MDETAGQFVFDAWYVGALASEVGWEFGEFDCEAVMARTWDLH